MSKTVSKHIQELGNEFESYVIKQRRIFHAHPELSFEEHWTTDAIAVELDALQIPYERPTATGLVATIKGAADGAYDSAGQPARRLALRADIDALPVQEKTGLSYASTREGCMHACGHDCHIAMMLGAVQILHRLRDQLRGEVLVIFQPAEEIARGAKLMIEQGVLNDVDGIYGAHIWSELDAGKVSVEPGPRMANTDWFEIKIDGKSAHGAMPHKGIDAVVVGSQIVSALQALVSREVSPFESAVLTIGEFHAGVANNVVAGSALLRGTVRTFDTQLREQMHTRMQQCAQSVAAGFGAQVELEWIEGNPALYNDAVASERARNAALKVLGKQALGTYEGTLSGEDFAEYLNFVPGVFVFVGARNEEVDAHFPQHSCYYNVDEGVLIGGSMLAAQYAYDFLSED